VQKIYKVAIVGGGASGLISAITLTQGDNKIKGEDVVVLEKNDRILKKLIATGNGQANLSNANLSQGNYYGDRDFINAYFRSKADFSVEDYFLSLGLPFTTLSDGRKYPLSRQANAVVDILRFTAEDRNIEIRTGFNCLDISKKGDIFAIKGEDTVYAETVIFAVGGKASPSFGTDGKSYAILEKLGHSLTSLYPSLVQVKTETDKIKGLKGIKETACITAFDGDKPLKTATGDLLFTDFGMSGSAVFQVSGHLACAKNPVVKIEFLPELDEATLEKILERRKDTLKIPSREDLLLGILHKKLGQVIVKNQTDLSPKTLAKTLKNFYLKVKGTLGFDNAQVTKGGIDTKDLSPTTFESKLVKGLYITGEVLNVDGDCGGYNLDFAFTSGYLSANAIKKSL